MRYGRYGSLAEDSLPIPRYWRNLNMHPSASTGPRLRFTPHSSCVGDVPGIILVSREAVTAQDQATGRLEIPSPSPDQAPLLPRPFFSAARRIASASAPPCSCGFFGEDDVIDALENSRGLP